LDALQAVMVKSLVRQPAHKLYELREESFLDVEEEAVEHLVSSFFLKTYENNEVIYLQDDDTTNLYMVFDGYVRLSYLMEDGSAVLYAILGRGKLFGELGVFDGGQQCDMTMSVGSSTIGSMSTKRFRELCERFPTLHEGIAILIAQRFRSYIELTRIMSLRRLQSRASCALLRIVDTLDQCASYEGTLYPCLRPVVTQTDLAIMARGSRGNINRALKAWERAGWIILRNRMILIKDRPALEALAFEDEL
jgi:CRP-like cAMP-binding protein